MVRTKKMLLIAVLAVLLAATWIMVVTGKPRIQAKQDELLGSAQVYLADEIYVTALPLLQEAADIDAARSTEARQLLIDCYLSLGDERSAIGQLEGLAASNIADEMVYLKLAELYFSSSKFNAGIDVLQQGMENVGSQAIADMYESNRFRYLAYYTAYESISGISGGVMSASLRGKQGHLYPDNGVAVGFAFDKATDFDNGKAMVIDGGKTIIINGSGQRLALCKEQVEDIAPLGGGIGAVKIGGSWYYVDTDFNRDNTPYEYIGRLSGGYRAVKQDGKWYLHDSTRKPAGEAFEDIKLDSDGNAVGMDRVFVRQGDRYILCDTAGMQVGGDSYEDAYPFVDGPAAVKQDGSWRFINADGSTALEGDFAAARSFGCELAPVQLGGKWGYIDTNGVVRIPAEYDEAQPMRGGAAAVRKDTVWRLIQLRTYKN